MVRQTTRTFICWSYSDWWLNKIEEVINDIPDNDEGIRIGNLEYRSLTGIKQQLLEKWLGK